MLVIVLLLAALLTGCDSPTAPTGGTATVTLTGVSVPNGGTAVWDRGVDLALTITASDDLLRTIRNVHVGSGRVAFYVCLSQDGVTFTSQCQAGLGVGPVQARVVGPSESSGIAVTSHLIAFVIPPEDYGTPVTAAIRFLGGHSVPSSALAVHVLPWRIEWRRADDALRQVHTSRDLHHYTLMGIPWCHDASEYQECRGGTAGHRSVSVDGRVEDGSDSPGTRRASPTVAEPLD